MSTADSRHILLVEDNDDNRDMLSRRLRKRGFEVSIAEDGERAVALASELKLDLILMDMSLPRLDGWSATQQIRKIPGMESLPIIALTAHAMSGDRTKALEAGCTDYDTKPVDIRRLMAKILVHLDVEDEN